MQPLQRERIPFLGGRNYIESLVYTLTYLEFQRRLDTGRENLGFLVRELERQLCGLARAVPQLKKIYHEYVRETLAEYYKDYPLPEFERKCSVRATLVEWFRSNRKNLFKRDLIYVHPDQIEVEIQRRVDVILHEAIMGTLYKAGVLSHA